MEAFQSPLSPKEADAMRMFLILHPFLGPPGGPELMSDRPRDIPKDAQGGFEVENTRLWTQLHAKINLGHDFEQF